MKLAIVKLSAMGDIIHAMVALQFIKKQRPDVQIDWIVEEAFVGVLAHNPDIHRIIPLQLKSIKKSFRNLFKELKKVRTIAKNEYDLVIDAQGLLKSALVSRLIGSRVAGFGKNSIRESIASYFYTTTVDIPYHENTIIRNIKVLCEPLGVVVDVAMIEKRLSYLFFDAQNRVQIELYGLFVIGSTWESRNYPKEQFATLANLVTTEIYLVWGSEAERQKAIWIEQHTHNCHVLPKSSLDELKAIVAGAQFVVGNDTGPTHMAWALGVPSVTLFGPTPTSRIIESSRHKALKSPSHVNPYKLDKNDFSIKEISAPQIAELIQEVVHG